MVWKAIRVGIFVPVVWLCRLQVNCKMSPVLKLAAAEFLKAYARVLLQSPFDAFSLQFGFTLKPNNNILPVNVFCIPSCNRVLTSTSGGRLSSFSI